MMLVLLTVSFGVMASLTETNAIPVTDIKKLPSITVDTLYNPQPEADSETSESIPLIRTMMQGTKFIQKAIRPSRQEANYVTFLRLPWRLARNFSTQGYGMARGFMDAFSHHFMEAYKNMQQNVIPQASDAFAVWANPPQSNSLETPWLDGGV